MSAIEKAIALALNAHEGQVDKGGAPYILHPLRVMATVEQMCPGCPEEVLLAAVLHDVIEDSFYHQRDIEKIMQEAGCLPETAFQAALLVLRLTKQDGQSEEEYYDQIKESEDACYIKLADLRDNMDISRLSVIGETDLVRINNYKRREQEIIAAIASFH